MKNLINILLLLFVSFTFIGCEDFELPEEFVADQTTKPEDKPTATDTITITDVSTATATLKYNSEYADNVIFHYSSDNKKYTFTGEKYEYTFIAKLPLLKANTTYTCFAEVDGKRTKEETFTTKPHFTAEPVDLGLSVKWASWNVGATSIDEPGGLYGYSDITETNFSTYNSSYYDSDIWGSKYDIARTKWGKNWRMPTSDEMRELLYDCTWILKEGYYEVVGPNGNYIHLPICGYRDGYITKYTYRLYYWTGEHPSYYYSNALYSNNDNYIQISEKDPYIGMSIRPVYSYTSN